MGWYINTDKSHNKAQWLVNNAGGIQLTIPPPYDEIPDGYCLIVVVHNPLFEAAGFAFSKDEYLAFTDPPNDDKRFREYVLIKRDKAIQLTNFHD